MLAGIAVVSKYVCGAENHGATKESTNARKRQVERAIRGPYHQARAAGLPWTVVLRG